MTRLIADQILPCKPVPDSLVDRVGPGITAVIIPARLESTRLPRKLLLSETGKPLIQHTYEIAMLADVGPVLVATDSPEIADAVRSFGGGYILTGTHQCGTDRVAEAVRSLRPDVRSVINLQGDEPELRPEHLRELVRIYRLSRGPVCTLATALLPGDMERRDAVKVVVNLNCFAFGFYRTVPDDLHMSPGDEIRRHVGVYMFERRFLDALMYNRAADPSVTATDSLEQTEWLERGCRMGIAVIDHSCRGVDTRGDYDNFVGRYRAGMGIMGD